MGVGSTLKGWATRAREILWWLSEPHLFWFTTALVLAATVLAIHPGATELQVRAIAAVLQLFGVVQVAIGVRDTRRLFGRPGVVEYTREWWKRFPTGSKHIKVIAGRASLGSLRANVRGTVTRNPQPGAPLEERVAALEHNVAEASKRIDRAEADINRAAQEHGERLEGEARLRAEGDAANRKLVEATQTGGLALSTAGAVVLAVGIILGSFPDELAGCAGRW